MPTARTIIHSALRKLGVLASGETPSAAEADDALASLNALLASGATSRLTIPRIAQEALSVSVSPVVLAVRPMRILHSTVRDGQTDYAVAALSREEWMAIPNKSRRGRPEALWWDEMMPTSSLFLFPVPDRPYDLTLQRWDRMQEFPTLDDAMTLPAEYTRALVYNLAVELAPEYGQSVSAAVAAVAAQSLSILAKYHVQVPSLTTEIARLNHGGLW